jgi:hypothetical protein
MAFCGVTAWPTLRPLNRQSVVLSWAAAAVVAEAAAVVASAPTAAFDGRQGRPAQAVGQFRVAIGLLGKTQVGHSQVLKILAMVLVLLCFGEHIGRSKAVCISRPHHWRSSNVPDLIRNHDAAQSFRVLAAQKRNRYGVALRAPPIDQPKQTS